MTWKPLLGWPFSAGWTKMGTPSGTPQKNQLNPQKSSLKTLNWIGFFCLIALPEGGEGGEKKESLFGQGEFVSQEWGRRA